MNVKAIALATFGAVVGLLGVLWLVQGLGLVEIGPILCVADCEPITGESTQWTVIGMIALILGFTIVRAGLRRASR
ncbi:hypothetical protein ZOD2009_15791 [Haladaptatus paucihalophilus DX253]|uniref:Uncharacterized protein n=1 Tax=Haladaptatus paucihalophilus DX253 TaxID=797209 RepID=E7QWH0_HALPU|nr:hypothetical protein ZOD2009_15791 [Haladaptatus paucihalophilus DX253]SHL38282.1 hypothetical protein SAMN05444342_3724 [Haladaptatus paucihalophilus DX253]